MATHHLLSASTACDVHLFAIILPDQPTQTAALAFSDLCHAHSAEYCTVLVLFIFIHRNGSSKQFTEN